MQEAPPEIKQVFEMQDLRQYVVCEAQCKDPPWAKYSEVESAHGVRAAKMIQDVVDRHCMFTDFKKWAKVRFSAFGEAWY